MKEGVGVDRDGRDGRGSKDNRRDGRGEELEFGYDIMKLFNDRFGILLIDIRFRGKGIYKNILTLGSRRRHARVLLVLRLRRGNNRIY